VRVAGVCGLGVDADVRPAELLGQGCEGLLAAGDEGDGVALAAERRAMDELRPWPAPRMSTRCGSIGVELVTVVTP
jgi:hypothetical protein